MTFADDVRQRVLDKLKGKTPTDPVATYSAFPGVIVRAADLTVCEVCFSILLLARKSDHESWHIEMSEADIAWKMQSEPIPPLQKPDSESSDTE